MSGVLVATVALPLVAALAIVLRLPTTTAAARTSRSGASAASFAARSSILIVTAIDGPTSAVVTDDEGRAVLGFAADRVGGVLIALTDPRRPDRAVVRLEVTARRPPSPSIPRPRPRAHGGDDVGRHRGDGIRAGRRLDRHERRRWSR